MTAPRRQGSNFRRFFLRGLTVLLPSILTLWILWSAFTFVFNRVAEPINAGLRRIVIRATPALVHPDLLPEWHRVSDDEVAAYRAGKGLTAAKGPDDEAIRYEIRAGELTAYWRSRWYLQAAGLLVAISLIYLAGLILGGFLGRKLYGRIEALIARIPGFKQVYPHIKQLVDLVLGDKPMAFNKVVLVQFPKPGTWAVGFVTGKAIPGLPTLPGTGRAADFVSVFVPNTPTPFTGFTLSVPLSEVIEVPVSIDEALRYVITGGVLVPGQPGGPSLPAAPGPDLAAAVAAANGAAGAVPGVGTGVGGTGAVPGVVPGVGSGVGSGVGLPGAGTG